jgi:GxxExxY protein
MKWSEDIYSESEWLLAESRPSYGGEEYPMSRETYEIIGFCMEIHRTLGPGLAENLYKDAMEVECDQRKLKFEREKLFEVTYKGVVLKHRYKADFVIGDIIVEVKAQEGGHENAAPQLINYLALAKAPVGLLINFGESSLRYKRYALSKNKLDGQ